MGHPVSLIYFRGGSYLVGDIVNINDEEYEYDGNVVFIYPDLITALSGHFRSGRMISSHLVHVSDWSWRHNIPYPVTRVQHCNNHVYSYQPSGSLCISRSPLLRDPYEMRYVYVGESGAGDSAGEGLFAKTDIKQGSLVALFNGVRQQRLSGRLDTKTWSDYRNWWIF